jgi:hypothetical protein
MSPFHEAESKSILIGLSFRLSPSNVCDLLAQEPNHERILTFDFERIHGEELRDLFATTCLSCSRATGSKRLSSSGGIGVLIRVDPAHCRRSSRRFAQFRICISLLKSLARIWRVASLSSRSSLRPLADKAAISPDIWRSARSHSRHIGPARALTTSLAKP